MVLLSAQGMDVARIAEVAFTSEDRVRAVLHNFNDDGYAAEPGGQAAAVGDLAQPDQPRM
jgi:hypothetical protein